MEYFDPINYDTSTRGSRLIKLHVIISLNRTAIAKQAISLFMTNGKRSLADFRHRGNPSSLRHRLDRQTDTVTQRTTKRPANDITSCTITGNSMYMYRSIDYVQTKLGSYYETRRRRRHLLVLPCELL